ncbi:hypothetical protein FNV58_00755 (plasmid) [Streptomyces sp. RLB1-9]|uniref:hypothetical protein n=1 Tax=Streptomyces sp. RLB1-9 TaxID=2594454 RepID=UPI0011650FD5|nr:hypothetical protein [Streptomyces sp. RLB1-9]QDN94890.1 hypothetical protein FNV58_00755 [Streptomyces sp. RLB1-9]
MTRTIENTTTEAQHDWPESVYIQGGEHGVVFGAADGPYQTAFFEAFPGGTFLRGEGKTLAEAEEKCWKQYQVFTACDGTGEPHGPFERRQYTNGAGFCTRCGIWMSQVFDPIPDDPNRERRLIERVFVDRDPEAIEEVLTTVADAASLPHAPSGD